ncbi:KTSC domain-containing protein [Undibacter mobilis]|uniref:KTSC domain-containing protein n=1 Tax=Undibacter mobilis TaxID=2292256 RepID=A0A371BCI9_9BRAD|nr:KTSC domain-containing protein [Undibacter mobilis]RDV05268.1 KTSC domain-containing protein [Undibacter mobilis]
MPSSVVAKIAYDEKLSRLVVTFVSGRVYEYYLVPPSVADSFSTAPSKGTYFNEHIRDNYTCREITSATSFRRSGT